MAKEIGVTRSTWSPCSNSTRAIVDIARRPIEEQA
jgi:hypothetical protein